MNLFKSLVFFFVFGISMSLYAQKYLALGDSYTIGESVLESERWPNQFAQIVKGTPLEVASVTIIAKTGWTTAELIEGIKKYKNTNRYNLVSLLIGVNNQYREQSIETFEEELVELIHTAINYCSKGKEGVFLVSIPDWGVTPFAKGRDSNKIAREIDAYNAIVLKQAKLFKIPFVDITPISKRAKTDESLLAEDKLHPSGKMYSLWVEKIKKQLNK